MGIENPTYSYEVSKDSYSYPGLPALYKYYKGMAIVKGLPEGATFRTTEFKTDGSIKRFIVWEWEDVVRKPAVGDRVIVELPFWSRSQKGTVMEPNANGYRIQIDGEEYSHRRLD